MSSLPKDANHTAMQLAPTGAAKAQTLDTSISSSTEITLNSATKFLRIYATLQDAYFKWGTANVTNANFDEICPAGQIIDLPVPVDSSTGSLYTACNVLERASGGAIIVIEKG